MVYFLSQFIQNFLHVWSFVLAKTWKLCGHTSTGLNNEYLKLRKRVFQTFIQLNFICLWPALIFLIKRYTSAINIQAKWWNSKFNMANKQKIGYSYNHLDMNVERMSWEVTVQTLNRIWWTHQYSDLRFLHKPLKSDFE